MKTVAGIALLLIGVGCSETPYSEDALFREAIGGGKVEVIIEGKIHKVRLCGIKPKETETDAAIKELVSVNAPIVVVRNGDVAEIFVATETGEEIHLNGELLLRDAADLDEGSVDSCPNGEVLRNVKQ